MSKVIGILYYLVLKHMFNIFLTKGHFKMAKGIMQILASMEDFDNNVDENVDFVEAAEVETQLLEANEEGAVVEEMVEELEVAEEAAEALESLITSLEAISENGGMDQNAAVMYRIAQESIYSRLGMTVESSSLESFSSSSSRYSATVLSLEEEKSRFRQVIDSIWKFIQETARKFVAWLKSYLTALGSTERRAKALKEKINKDKNIKFEGKLTEKQQEQFGRFAGTSEFAKASVIDMSIDYASFLDTFKKANFGESLVKVQESLVTTAEKLNKDGGSVDGSDINKINEGFATIVKALASSNSVVNDTNTSKKTIGTIISKAADKVSDVLGISNDTKQEKPQITVTGARTTVGGLCVGGFSSSNSIGLVAATRQQEENLKYTGVLPASAQEATKVLDNVLDIVATQKALNDSVNKAVANPKKLDKLVASRKDEGASAETRKLLQGYRKTFGILVQISTAVSASSTTVSKGLLDLVQISMKSAPKEENA